MQLHCLEWNDKQWQGLKHWNAFFSETLQCHLYSYACGVFNWLIKNCLRWLRFCFPSEMIFVVESMLNITTLCRYLHWTLFLVTAVPRMLRVNLATIVALFFLHCSSSMTSEPQHYLMAMLAPVDAEDTNLHNKHSSSAVTLAMDAVHNDSQLAANIRLRWRVACFFPESHTTTNARNTHRHTRTYTYTNARARARARTHAHSRSHAHTQSNIYPIKSSCPTKRHTASLYRDVRVCSVVLRNSGCDSKTAIANAVRHYVSEDIDVFIGPACSGGEGFPL